MYVYGEVDLLRFYVIIQTMTKYILFYTLIAVAFYANAQQVEISEGVQNRNLGVQYGQIYSYVESKISEETTIYTEPEKGYELSIMYDRIFSRFFSVQSGLQYQSINFKLGPDRQSLSAIQLEKIVVPLIFSFNSDLCKKVNFSLFSGPVLGATISSSINSLSVEEISRDTTITVVSVKNPDFGIMYGAAMEISIDKLQVVKLLIGGRGTYGISDIYKEVNSQSNHLNIIPENSTIKTFGGFIGLKFALYGIYEYRELSE